MLSFNDCIGQSGVITHLTSAISEGKVSHAYLISGDEGSGKMMIAERFAAALQCTGLGTRPCGSCIACMQSESHNHPDIVYVTHDRSMIRVDDIRSQVIADIAIKPYSGQYKIYIIDDADKMNEQAQNALLKTLEEPPAYAVIILLAINTGAFLPTILSRCVQLTTHPVEQDVITSYLTANARVPDYFARLCSAFSEGSIGKALRYASDEAFGHIRDDILRLVHDIGSMTRAEILDFCEMLGDESHKALIPDYLSLLRLWYRDVLVFKSTGDLKRLLFAEEADDVRRDAGLRTYAGLNDILSELDHTEQSLGYNIYLSSAMELLLLTMKKY